MLRVGLTGGIASGKSTVARLFARLGVPIIDTDVLAREIVEPGKPALAQLLAAFGPGILAADGSLDRRLLRERVFRDPDERQRLESILHPAIRAEMERRSAGIDAPYHILVIPLLVEGGGQDRVDRVLVVDCPAELQLARLEDRDALDRNLARRMLAAQATRTQRLAVADDVIVNSGSIVDLEREVARLHSQYLALAAGRGRAPNGEH